MTHFCCANPGLPYGGLLEYSKQAISNHLPSRVSPATAVVTLNAGPSEIATAMRTAGIGYPCIIKPDRGERGLFVEKIPTDGELRAYLRRMHTFVANLRKAGLDVSGERLLVQEYVDEPSEFGVMWIRHPDEARGRVTSIVHKEFLSVVGDGRASLAQLISAGERTRLHERMLCRRYADDLSLVLPTGVRRLLVEIGNHVRGATFLDAGDQIDAEITDRFAAIARAIPGFHVGRFDVRCRDVAALRRGAFTVIEVNAVASEPAHIYDPANSLRSAYRDLLSHWRAVERVATANRRRGCRPPRLRELVAAIGRHRTRLKAARAVDRV